MKVKVWVVIAKGKPVEVTDSYSPAPLAVFYGRRPKLGDFTNYGNPLCLRHRVVRGTLMIPAVKGGTR